MAAATFVAPGLAQNIQVTTAPTATHQGTLRPTFPSTGAAAALSVAGALVARSVGGQRRKLKQGKVAKVQCKASTLDQLKQATGASDPFVGWIMLWQRYWKIVGELELAS